MNSKNCLRKNKNAMLKRTNVKPIFIRHEVVAMDESQVQRCVICGALITDDRNMVSPTRKVLQGFPEGAVYVSNTGFTTNTDMAPEYEVQKCKP